MALTLRQRYQILKRDHFMCLYCGARPPAVELAVDHVRSRANGGSDDPSNLVTACEPCNQGKSAASVDACATCVRPLCRGPKDPRDALEAGCACGCHRCIYCNLDDCVGVSKPGVCPNSEFDEGDWKHDVYVEELFDGGYE